MSYYLLYDINVPSVGSKFLARDQSNTLLRGLQFIPGDPNSLGWSFQGSECTGGYLHDQGTLGFASLKYPMFLMSMEKLSFVNKFGFKLDLNMATQSADKSVTLDYLTTLTSNVQDQINALGGGGGGGPVSPHTLVSHTDWPPALSITELGYLSSVTSDVQTQLNNVGNGAFCIATGTSNALVCDPVTPVSLVDGAKIYFKAAFANTAPSYPFYSAGPCTINVSSTGVKSLIKNGQTGIAEELDPSQLNAGSYFWAEYRLATDKWQLMNPLMCAKDVPVNVPNLTTYNIYQNIIDGMYTNGPAQPGLYNCILLGTSAGASSTTAQNCIHIGKSSGFSANGNWNIGIGGSSGNSLSGSYNNLYGFQSGLYITSGSYNNYFGTTINTNSSIARLVTGSYNTIIGFRDSTSTGGEVSSGSYNTSLGYDCEVPVHTANNQLSICNQIYGTGLTGTKQTSGTGFIGVGIKAPTCALDVKGSIATDTDLSIKNSGFKSTITAETLASDVSIVVPNISGTIGLREDNYVIKTNSEPASTVFPGMAVKLFSTTGCKLANATSDVNFAIGLSRTTSTITTPVTIQLLGKITIADWTDATGSAALTVGSTYYLSASTSGQITTTPPINPQIIGVALSDTELLLKIP